MSARVFNVPSTAPLAVPVLCPSPGLDAPPQNPESTVGLHQEFLGDGDGRVPSGSRIPFLLDQGNAYGRDDRSVLSAAVQVPPAVAVALAWVSAFALFVSVGAQVPPAFVEGPTLVLGSSFTVSAVVGAPAQPIVVGYRLCIRFAVPPVAGLSTPEPAEG